MYSTNYSVMDIGPYFDPAGEFEWNTTLYKLSVIIPPRTPLRRSLVNLLRTPGPKPAHNHHEAPLTDGHANPCYSSSAELSDLPRKSIVLKSKWFPSHMRCEHVQGKDGYKEGVKGCKEGCYLLERGGDEAAWNCPLPECEGHVYCGKLLKDDKGGCCFGKKGERMVCLKPVEN